MGTPIRRPPTVNPCGCGGEFVHSSDDGISTRYECAECDTLLADLILGSEP